MLFPQALNHTFDLVMSLYYIYYYKDSHCSISYDAAGFH